MQFLYDYIVADARPGKPNDVALRRLWRCRWTEIDLAGIRGLILLFQARGGVAQ